MNYRNLRALLNAHASRLVLSVEDGEDGAAAGGGAAEGGEAAAEGGDPAPEPAAAGAEPAAAAAAEGGDGEAEPPAPKSTRVPWQTKRIDQLTATAKTEREARERAEAEAAETKRQLDAYRAVYGKDAIPPTPGATTPAPATVDPAAPKTYTEADFNAAVAQRAKLSTIDSTLNTWYDAGVKSGGEAFKAMHQKVGQAFGDQLPGRVDFYEALTSLPNGSQVYDQLAGDLDHFADVLAMGPMQLGLELGRMSAAADAKPARKGPAISQLPAPITPIEGAGGEEFDAETASMDDYYKQFEARQRRRAEAG